MKKKTKTKPQARTGAAKTKNVPAVLHAAPMGAMVHGAPMFILAKNGVMRWQRMPVKLHVADKTLVTFEIKRKDKYCISAEGFRRMNQIARVMPVQSPDVLCEPAPPAPLDVVTIKGAAVGYTGGSVAVHSLSMRYDIRARLLHSLMTEARWRPESAQFGTKGNMSTATKDPSRWAFYPIDETAGVWVDLKNVEIQNVLLKHQNVRAIADRYARTHWERNIIRTFMPGVPLDVTERYDRKTDTAVVIMEGYFPDVNSDAREVQKRLVEIATGRIDAMDAKVAQFSVIIGRDSEVDMIEAQAIEDADPEAAGDDTLRTQSEPGSTPRQESADTATANELLRKIDSELFFGVTVEQANVINKKYAPLANKPVAILRQVLAELKTMQK